MPPTALRPRAFIWLLVNVAVVVRMSIGCTIRSLSVTADDSMRLYIDGREVTDLRYSNNWKQPDKLQLPCTTRVIAIEAIDIMEFGSILAFTDDGYIETNTSWKCTNVRMQGWQMVDFNDSTWKKAVVLPYHEPFPNAILTTIRADARWIWTQRYKDGDRNVFCRRTIDVDYCRFGRPINECEPSMGRCTSLLSALAYNCSCFPAYENDGQRKCKDVDECLTGSTENKCNTSSGNCVNTPGSYRCRCYQGFINVGDQQCEGSSDNSTLLLILAVSLGVFLLVVLALVVTLSILCSRNHRGARIDNTDTKAGHAVGQPSANRTKVSTPSEGTYSHLELQALRCDQNEIYEQIIQ